MTPTDTSLDGAAAGLLPAARTGQPLPDTRAAAPNRLGQALVRSIGAASRSVHRLDDHGHDVAVGALATAQCTAATQHGALRAAAAFLRGAPGLQLHGALWARVPDIEGTNEYWLTLLLSDIDPETGDADGATHHADDRTTDVSTYLDAASAFTGRALPLVVGLDHTGDTPAEAFEAAAELFEHGQDLHIDGILWAQLPSPRPHAHRYRLTLLTAATGKRG